MEGEKIKISAFLVQTAAAMSIACLTLLTGFVYAWPSYTLANFRSNDTVLSYPLSTWQVSLLGSVTNIGGLVVTPTCGYIVDRLGRKYSAMLFGLPNVITWGIISVTTNVPLVIGLIGFAGAGAAGQAISSIYIGEICHESIRGALTSTTVSCFFAGLLFSYTLGGYLTYHQVVYVHLSLSILYILLLTLFAESPVYLMKIGKEQEAKKAIAFYRRVDVSSKEVEVEIAKIKLQLDPRIDQILESSNEPAAAEGLIKSPPAGEAKPESTWKYLKKSKSSRRALLAVIMVMSLTILMGSIVLQVYAEPLFQEAVPTMSANTCSIFLAIDYLIAALVCASMLDKFGRKFLLTWTSIGSGVFCVLLGTQLHLHWGPHWFTAFCIYGFCFIYNLGAGSVPFVLTAEVFLPEIRGFGNSVSMAFMWIMNFVTLVIFNPLADAVGLGVLFYGFSVVCFIGALYSHICLPETKGLTVDVIQLLFLGKRRASIVPKA
ncbi:facilitated trehalose transporter Tret1-2 homolog [Epargyreus clarus]|uniref:facilitated trehalose transporter Tret1-2 homolog n=1 Tax=Epargyreus clarus TaxID=520877 RepID=UPI003C2B6C1F